MIEVFHRNTEQEIERIVRFIRNYAESDETVIVPVSGGIDSDVTARLCCKSLGRARVKLFMAIQDDMEDIAVQNAHNLAEDLSVPFAQIHLEGMNKKLIEELENAEGKSMFRTDMMLDSAKAKCSVRSAVISCYQDKGFLIAGCVNRTEKELGFFLTFGDNLSHFKPIAHLYKSELPAIAKYLGTAESVIGQSPSAGFWKGQTDLEDIAYWIINGGPILFPRAFSEEEECQVNKILSELSFEKIDRVLYAFYKGHHLENISQESGLSKKTVEGIIQVVRRARKLKNRRILAEIQD